MAVTIQLTARQREVLMAIVENYIATGEPVSSGAIARSGQLSAGASSPATIRNEMAALVDAGLLEQPHTSAGRVPSAAAFRLYVEGLRGGRPALAGRAAGPSRAEVESRIDSSLRGIAGAEALLERTSQVLAMVSSGVGVAISALPSQGVLEHVHFSRIAASRVLVVLVTRSGMVRDRLVVLDRDFSTLELETASRFLNENFRGWTLDRVRAELASRVDEERSAYRAMAAAAQHLWAQAMPEGAVQAVFVEGVANLVSVGDDRERLRVMLEALEAKERLIDLLNAYIGNVREESVRVVFDLERDFPAMAGLVLVAAPARVAGDTLATVGVLGSTRMDYESTMNAVGYIAAMFDRVLGSSSEPGVGRR